jgi:hypothetical protein
VRGRRRDGCVFVFFMGNSASVPLPSIALETTIHTQKDPPGF